MKLLQCPHGDSKLLYGCLRPIQPPIHWVPGPLFLGVKQLGCEADESPPAIAEVKKTWVYTSTPSYIFMT
jgi:hypothetical protein